MRLVSVAEGRSRRAAEEAEKERPAAPSHRSNHQFASMKNKFYNELTHLPSGNNNNNNNNNNNSSSVTTL
ncbi:hypothetical protein EYF80_059681 [Liparis tanakae]|uniref:Uncharacterized protein n=1 Tax=Liparis tanakae TaxID=230148 RepID=A0A4Z2EN45_9TELE|nr:hypothetical protein EYF80_059681 [Liparis tanakae]